MTASAPCARESAVGAAVAALSSRPEAPAARAPAADVKPVVLFPHLGDGDFGGSHISSLKLVEALREHGRYEPVVAAHRPDGAVAAQIRDMLAGVGAELEAFPEAEVLQPDRRPCGGRRAGSTLGYAAHAWRALSRTIPRLARYLKSRGVAIVHTNDGWIHPTWALAARAAGARMIWHHRADPLARGVNMLAPLLADRIITVSDFAKPKRPILPIAHKTRVIRSPFDPPMRLDRDAARAAVLAELGLPPETRLIGWAGVLVERKRPVDMADVVRHLRDARPDLPVAALIFGAPMADGPRLDQALIARAKSLGVADAIHMMGFRHPIEPYMAALDALVVPAMNEPFGRTLIEAMQIGTVVAAYDHGGNPEAIEHGRTGYLVEPLNPKAFVEPLAALLSDADIRARISGAALQEARDAYTRERHLQGVVEVYDEILSKGGRRAGKQDPA